ncbi:hypothetical protein NL676_005501 [Syzygium grande]|nr:hypothetical protein NL676_005501 [Syzygium grande]
MMFGGASRAHVPIEQSPAGMLEDGFELDEQARDGIEQHRRSGQSAHERGGLSAVPSLVCKLGCWCFLVLNSSLLIISSSLIGPGVCCTASNEQNGMG